MDARRVLVIDQPSNLEAMVRSGLLYYPVEIAFSTGRQDALSQILSVQPDLLIAGLKFLDGTILELLQEVKDITTYVPPGIYLADGSDAEIQKEVIKLGALDILSRPFEMSVLHKKIDHAVKTMKTFNAQSRFERFSNKSKKYDNFQELLEESRNLGMPVAELIKLKQLST